ncbi:MAG: hypothetical protein ACRECJ_05645, partial [Limisphaerales bacterium]
MPVGGKKEKENLENGRLAGLAARKEEFIHQEKERLTGLPDVRPDRIRKACLRASQGFYDRPQVVAKIADRF